MTLSNTLAPELEPELNLRLELADSRTITVPISFDYSTLTPEDADLAVSIANGDQGRLTMAFVAVRATQGLGLAEDDIAAVTDTLSGVLAGDFSDLVIEGEEEE